MKFLIFSALLGASLSSAFACEQYEAQFVAKVSSMEVSEDGTCKIAIDQVEHYSAHYFCPLFVETVKNNGIDLKGEACSVKVGERVHGILIDDGKTITIE